VRLSRGLALVDHLRTHQEVVVGFPAPATAADPSAGNPHRDSKAARSTRPSGGPPLLNVIVRSGIARLRSGGFFGRVADRAERLCNACATEKGHLIMQTAMHRRTR
jgi:hypothetical protein